jgi:hypothetical protein
MYYSGWPPCDDGIGKIGEEMGKKTIKTKSMILEDTILCITQRE